ncbi:SAM-dependent methyltransferase [Mycolicibacillus trivialis]|uniref:SAM-dependent methyltransferase n=2 Tax=Mycolicibacillus trivialis TaxID=1798 RepID=A0A1X2EFG9_9MYCO|nr:cyclopropane mycolic acid synthase family methyltransferase [Mycolicibacillus trivialis]ORW98929.1 SAM-dependent methyltransferase [Mycolicibacillus trivialis]
MGKLEPKYDELQSIYDISDEFYELFLGPTMGYTCGYFEREDMTTSEAQNAKFDLALDKLGLEPGMTLLDIGCGWGGGLQRALETYDINVIGLTISKNQQKAAQARLAKIPTERNVEVRLQGWEEFDGKVDRIVSIGAFEHFGFERYEPFFEMAYNALPADGRMLLHTICIHDFGDRNLEHPPLLFSRVKFAKFIVDEIFPGGRLPTIKMVEDHADRAGFALTRRQSLQQHYVRTLELWAEALHANKERALAVQGQVAYDRFDKYLVGCADMFRNGYTDINQFTLQK